MWCLNTSLYLGDRILIFVSKEPSYTIVDPKYVFQGKTYADYLAEYWNWLYSVNCDSNNVGDVLFCRGVEFPEPPAKSYTRGPVVMVGDKGLTISSDQAVFFSAMTSNAEAVGDRADYIDRDLRAKCIQDLNAAGVPDKTQILIDNKPIDLPGGVAPYRVVTREYHLTVPDSEYGTTIAPFMDEVLPPGIYRCVAAGYCFLVQFEKEGYHTLYSVARGKPWKEGDYISELFYEINVLPRSEFSPIIPTRKFVLTDQLQSRLEKMKEKKEITDEKFAFLKTKMTGARKEIRSIKRP